jgi:transcription antitermination factor NusG
MQFWYVFTTAPNKERPAAQELGRRGWLVNVPLMKRNIRSGPTRRRSVDFAPVIPGYVFIFMDGAHSRNFERIFKAEFPDGDRCVRQILKFAGEYGKITPEVMREFLQHVKAESERASSVKHSVKVGDTVRVKNGAFAGQIVKVGSVEGTRACILMEMFKQSTPALVSIHNLELATAEEKTPIRAGDPLHCGANQSTRYPRDVGRSATGGVSRQQEVPRAKWAR